MSTLCPLRPYYRQRRGTLCSPSQRVAVRITDLKVRAVTADPPPTFCHWGGATTEETVTSLSSCKPHDISALTNRWQKKTLPSSLSGIPGQTWKLQLVTPTNLWTGKLAFDLLYQTPTKPESQAYEVQVHCFGQGMNKIH